MISIDPVHNADFIPIAKADVEHSIPELFRQRTERFADRVAVESSAKSYTYRAFNTAANRIAHAIIDQLGRANEPVAILITEKSDAVVAIFAALKAGKIYLPLDPTQPMARLRYLIQDSQARLIVAENATLATALQLSSGGACSILNIDHLSDASGPTDDRHLPITPDCLASLLYTSGSTAEPKGVLQNHRNLIHIALRFTNAYRLTRRDRIALLRSLTVSGGTLLCLGALLNGATLFPFDFRENGIIDLAPWLRSHAVTVCSLGPSLLRSLAQIMADSERVSSLRCVTLSGELLYRTDLQLCKKLFSPRCALINSLGATEAPIAVQHWVDSSTEMEGSLVPVGYPAEDIKVTLLADDGQMVRTGEAGQIALQSRYLAVGYWGKPDLTRARFLPCPDTPGERIYLTGDLGRFTADGKLLHLGRNDDFVKIRGHRIGLKEVEAALLEHSCVKEVSVIAWDETKDENRLVGYIVAGADGPPTRSELSSYLRSRLPEPMIPGHFVFMSEFPRINQKIDRKALPRIDWSRRDPDLPFVAPRSAIERALAAIWEQCLEISPIGMNDPFLNLGGDSLKAARIIASLKQSLDCEVSIAAFFDAQTIAGLAERLLDHERERV